MHELAIIYEMGDIQMDIKQDVNKAIELFDRSADLGCSDSLDVIVRKYQKKDINHDRCAHFLMIAVNYEIDRNEYEKNKQIDEEEYESELTPKQREEQLHTYRNKLKALLARGKVQWKQEYHTYWDDSNNLNEKIVTLLLASKHRKESKLKESSFLVKGIVMDIIKYLCLYSLNVKK